MSRDSSSYVLWSVEESKTQILYKFRSYVIGDWLGIVQGLNAENVKARIGVTLKEYVVANGIYQTGYGHEQWTFGRDSFPLEERGRRHRYGGKSFPPKLSEGQNIDELLFEFGTPRGTRYNLRIYWDKMEVSPRPDTQKDTRLLYECLKAIKNGLRGPTTMLLEASTEYLTAAQVEFVGRRYRPAIHSLYYSMLSSTKALAARANLDFEETDHGSVSGLLSKMLQDAIEPSSLFYKNNTSALHGSFLEFLTTNRKKFHKALEIAQWLRSEADYRSSFEVVQYPTKFSELLRDAAELHEVCEMLCGHGSHWTEIGGKEVVLLLWKRKDLRIDDHDSILLSGLVIGRNFQAREFIFKLLEIRHLRIYPFTKHVKSFVIAKNLSRIIAEHTSDPQLPSDQFFLVNKKNFSDYQDLLFKKFVYRIQSNAYTFSAILHGIVMDVNIEEDGRFYFLSPEAEQDIPRTVLDVIKDDIFDAATNLCVDASVLYI